jgi:hypothetical protein
MARITPEGRDKFSSMTAPIARAALALALVSGWMALLFWGFALGGAVHLLLAAGLALFPWRSASASAPSPPGD